MSKTEFYETKLTNAANWLARTVERHTNNNQEVMSLVGGLAAKLKEDGGLRDNILNPQFRAVLLEQSLPARNALSCAREWFHITDEERRQMVDEKITRLEKIHKNFGDWIEVLKCDREMTSADFRTIGAYVEIFFGTILDDINKRK
jgi:hypothetical protein